MKTRIRRDTFPLAQAFSISRGSRTEAEVLRVIISKNGFTGSGECVPYARYDETLDSVSKDIEGLPEVYDRQSLHSLLPAGAARNAVDCALWDLEAKSVGKRVWELANIKKPGPEITAYTLSLDTPKNMEDQARINAFRPILKIKLGGADDLSRLKAVRRGAPNSSIIVDANEGWNITTYLDLEPSLKELGVKLVEQPLPAWDDDALLGLPRTIPICADESCHDRTSLEKLKGKYDIINIKLDKTGGLTEALALRSLATRNGFSFMVGCMIGSSLAMAPAILVAQGAKITDLDAPLLLAEDRANPLRYDKKGVHPPDKILWG